MSYWSPDDQEEVVVLTTQKPTPRWVRILLKILAVLLVLGAMAAGVIAWRYYAVQQRLITDLTTVIQEEERIRSLGGINAAPDLIDPRAIESWRFRYLSSVRARKGYPAPEIKVEKVEYDGFDARVTLQMNGVRQYRHYRLYAGHDWRRSSFVATGWGYKQTSQNADGFEIIYWDEDEAFVQDLLEDIPQLWAQMQQLGLAVANHKLILIPQEFGDLVHPARLTEGIVLNSPHVDWIVPPFPGQTPQQMLRFELSHRLIADARYQTPVNSTLPGAVRVQHAIDEILAWQWAAGDVPDAGIAAWRRALNGHWVSPVTGLPPSLMTELSPDAPDVAARLMMAWMLRKEGPDALLALSAALSDASNWDEAYRQVAGLTAAQVEQFTRQWMQHPQGPLCKTSGVGPGPAPDIVSLLTTSADAWGRLLARTPTGQTILLEPEQDAALALADGSPLDYGCVAAGTQVQVEGEWREEGLRLGVRTMVLEQAILPPILRPPPMSEDAEFLVWHSRRNDDAVTSQIVLKEWLPDHIINTLTLPISSPAPMPATLSRRQQPPLLSWQQDVRCHRAWLVAYDPVQGIVGAWLAPEDKHPINAVGYLPDADGKLLFAISPAESEPSSYYLSGDHHMLTSISPEAWPALVESSSHHHRAYVDAEQQTLHLYDIATQTNSLLYQSTDEEKLLAVIPAFGWPADAYFFAIRPQENPSELIRIMQISANIPGEVNLLFEASSRGKITSMARCPDGSILYGLDIFTATMHKGILRLHRPSGEDKALSPLEDEILLPIYCARAP